MGSGASGRTRSTMRPWNLVHELTILSTPWEGRERPVVVHFVVVEGEDIRPLCGDWAGSPNWSKIVAAVTCQRCRALLERPARLPATG